MEYANIILIEILHNILIFIHFMLARFYIGYIRRLVQKIIRKLLEKSINKN